MNTQRLFRKTCFFVGAAAVMGAVSCSTKFPVTFHLQGDDSDSTKMSFMQVIHGKQTKFVKSAFISNRDIENYRSFQDPKTGTYGAAFFLKPGAKNRYQAITAQNFGKLVIPMANGKPCEVFRIDGVYDQGFICIYAGLSREDMNQMKEVIDPNPQEKDKMTADDAKEKAKIDKLR